MDQYTNTLLRATLITALLTIGQANALAASWADDWVDNATFSGGGSYEGRERTFVTGGNFSMRNRVKTDYLMSVSPPRLNTGCGGIDGFMGGFSFLDADYLGDKLQSMITVAPYIALDLAMKSMSKEMSDTLKAAEGMINALNNIQLNECKAMKPVVSMMMGQGDAEGIKDVWAEQLNVDAIEKNATRLWSEFNSDTKDNDGEPAEGADLTTTVKDCPDNVQKLFKPGSLIKNVSNMASMEKYSDLMRGHLGDVTIIYNKVIKGKLVEACPNNANTVDGFLYGTGQEKTEDNVCKDSGDGLYDNVLESLGVIVESINNPNSRLGSAEIELIKRSQLPIVPMLEAGLKLGEVEQIKFNIADIVALKFASMATRDFYQNTYEALRSLKQTLQNPTDKGKTCDFEKFIQPAELAKVLLKDARAFKTQIDNEMTAKMNVMNQNQQYIEQYRRLQQKANQVTQDTHK